MTRHLTRRLTPNQSPQLPTPLVTSALAWKNLLRNLFLTDGYPGLVLC